MCGEHVFADFRGGREEGWDGKRHTDEDYDCIDDVGGERSCAEEDVISNPASCRRTGVGGAREERDGDQETAAAEEEDIEDDEDGEDLLVGHGADEEAPGLKEDSV